MSLKAVLAIVAIGLVAAAPAWGQNAVELTGGMGIPTGDLGDMWNSSLTLGAGAYLETTPFTALGVCFGYSRFGLDSGEDGYGAYNVQESGGDLSAINLCLEGRLKTGSMEGPYLYAGLGAGLYSVKISDYTLKSDGELLEMWSFDRSNQLGGLIGAGAAFPVNPNMKLGASLQYHYFTVSDDHGFSDLGDTRNFVRLAASLTFFI